MLDEPDALLLDDDDVLDEERLVDRLELLLDDKLDELLEEVLDEVVEENV